MNYLISLKIQIKCINKNNDGDKNLNKNICR